MRFFLFLFIVIPLIEMVVLIEVGGVIGAIPTVALVCLTALIGVSLIRAQGLSALRRAQWRTNHGELPAQEMMDGLCLAVAGAMLLTPGFVTDTFGFLLLVPSLRRHLFQKLASNVIVGGSVGDPQSSRRESRHRTLEGEYWRDK